MKKLVPILIALLLFPSFLSASSKQTKNVILIIGDGMGLAQVYASMIANGNHLNIERCTYSGFIKTYSYDHFITDTGAGATALACGVKTRNGMIGMSHDSVAVPSVLELASQNKMATGIVAAGSLTEPTPASFVAHVKNCNMFDAIAAGYLKDGVDVFIGGGKKYFDYRMDDQNLIDSLKARNYNIAFRLRDIKLTDNSKDAKLAGFICEGQIPSMYCRGEMISKATVAAINLLSTNRNGFFLMINSPQMDLACQVNDSTRLVKEMLNFDEAIGKVLDFAAKNKNTLVIITSTHETGGLMIPNGNIKSHSAITKFTSTNNTGIPVPVFSYGPGAENFSGMMENTDIPLRIEKVLQLNKK